MQLCWSPRASEGTHPHSPARAASPPALQERHASLTGWGLRGEGRGLVCKYSRWPAGWDGTHAHYASSGARVLTQ